MRMNARRIVLALAAVLLVGACSDVTAPAPGPEAALLGVLPEGGATSVSVETQVVLTFSHPLGPGMEAFAVLHVGDVNGPEVGGAWSLSNRSSGRIPDGLRAANLGVEMMTCRRC